MRPQEVVIRSLKVVLPGAGQNYNKMDGTSAPNAEVKPRIQSNKRHTQIAHTKPIR